MGHGAYLAGNSGFGIAYPLELYQERYEGAGIIHKLIVHYRLRAALELSTILKNSSSTSQSAVSKLVF